MVGGTGVQGISMPVVHLKSLTEEQVIHIETM